MLLFIRLSFSYLLILGLLVSTGCWRSANQGTLVMMLEKRLETFDPRTSSDSAVERVRQLVFNSLTRKGENFEPVPDLAESFEASPDYKTFTFKLRSGVKFHNGRPLSALDVKYTFDSMMAPGFASNKKTSFIRDLASVDVTDDPLTVIFRCRSAFPSLPNDIIPVGVIPEGSGEQQHKQPIGAGPFKFESYTEDQEIVLAAYEQYFEGAPQLKQLRIKIIPDNSTRESELRKGSVDLAVNADLEPVTVEALQKAPGLKVDMRDGTNIAHLGVNLLDPILKDQRVRQAISYAIDREAIIRDVLRNQARRAQSILPTSQWAYEPAAEAYQYNLVQAQKLLDEAGRTSVSGQPRLKLTLKTSTVSISRKTGEVLQEQLRRAGIALELLPLERQKLNQDMLEGNFQLYLNIMVGGNQSTDVFRYAYDSRAIPPNGQNRSRYSNAVVDQLLDESLTATRERRQQIFSQIQKTLALELPQIYLWYPATVVVYRAGLQNVKVDPSADWRFVRGIQK